MSNEPTLPELDRALLTIARLGASATSGPEEPNIDYPATLALHRKALRDLEGKAREMRNAIDGIEGAMMGWRELLDLPENCALDESDDDNLELEVKVTWGHLRRVLSAIEECTRIINSDEYVIADALQPQADGK